MSTKETAKQESGEKLIADERRRQRKMWDAEHDDSHSDHELTQAAYCYMLASRVSLVLKTGEIMQSDPPSMWPWEAEYWNPNFVDPIPNLVKAGALIAAEIDRLQRAAIAKAESR